MQFTSLLWPFFKFNLSTIEQSDQTAMMNFIFPPGGDSKEFSYHLGIGYIQAFLKEHGFLSNQIIPAPGSLINEIARKIINENTKILGFSCYDSNTSIVKQLAKIVRQLDENILIIAGGPTATFSYKKLLLNIPDIDIAVRYEGEQTTLNILRKYSLDKDTSSIYALPGIAYRKGKEIIETSLPEITLRDLDNLPSPYLTNVFNGDEGVGIITSRGCTHNCVYCNFAAMSRYQLRLHSKERVISELKFIEDCNILSNSKLKFVEIYDDAFTLIPERAKEICKRIIDEKINLPLGCMCRADNLDNELVGLLKQSGFIELTFGLESGSKHVLKNIRKARPRKAENKVDAEKNFLTAAQKAISLANAYQMRTRVSIILGLPGEEIEDGFKTIEFVKKLNVNSYQHNYLHVFPGTELFSTASKYNIGVYETESGFFETKHAYDTTKVPFLNNSNIVQKSRELTRDMLGVISGSSRNLYKRGKGIESVILWRIGNEFGKRFKKSLSDWTTENCSIKFNCLLFDDRNDYFSEIEKEKNSIFPLVGQFIFLNENNTTNNPMYPDGAAKAHGNVFNLTKNEIFFSSLSNTNIANNPKYELKTNNTVYCIQNQKDVDELKSIKIQKDLVLDGIIFNSCQFNRGNCPAFNLERLMVLGDGSLVPCKEGICLGSIYGQNIFRSELKRIEQELKENRGCNNCVANTWCSHCMCPSPLTQEEFCQWQLTNGFNMSSFISRTNLVQVTDFFS